MFHREIIKEKLSIHWFAENCIVKKKIFINRKRVKKKNQESVIGTLYFLEGSATIFGKIFNFKVNILEKIKHEQKRQTFPYSGMRKDYNWEKNPETPYTFQKHEI